MRNSKMKFRGMKTKIKILELNDIIDEDCFYSLPMFDYKNKPMDNEQYNSLIDGCIQGTVVWLKSKYKAHQEERVMYGHSHRIYIKVK